MTRSEIMSRAWRVARQRQSVYDEPLRESLARALSVTWSKAHFDRRVRAHVDAARARAEEIARTASEFEIAAELRTLDHSPRHEDRIRDLRLAQHIQKEATA